jgi:hypothetical protein
MDSSKTHYTLAAIVVVAAAALAWWFVSSYAPAPAGEVGVPAPTAPQSVAPEAPAPAVATSSLGASILEKAQNPVQGKVPELSPTANPVKDVYKNPFE